MRDVSSTGKRGTVQMPKPSEAGMPASGQPERTQVRELLSQIGDADNGEKAQTVDLLVSLGLDVVYPAIESAVRDDVHANLRNGAMELLVKFGPAALPYLFALIEDENEQVRNFATVMLGRIGDSAAVGPLIRALDDDDPNVRHGAAEALGKINDHAALEPLIELLNDGFWHRYAAIFALGEMRDGNAVPHLLGLLDDAMLIEPVIEALGKIGDERALSPLMAIMGSLTEGQASLAEKAVAAIRKQASVLFPGDG
jgi:HEAT repeat protein